MDVFEVIATTRAMRRLDPQRDVSPDDVARIIWAATKAPSGADRQPVRWIVVRDADQRRRLGEVYARVSGGVAPGAGAPKTAPKTKLERSIEHLVGHMGEAPVIIVVCATGDADVRTSASVYPAVQNLMLAARALGLGTTLTVRHRLREQEVKDVLGIPSDVHTFAMVPLGYPLGRWSEAKRRPVEEVTFLDRWGAPVAPR